MKFTLWTAALTLAIGLEAGEFRVGIGSAPGDGEKKAGAAQSAFDQAWKNFGAGPAKLALTLQNGVICGAQPWVRDPQAEAALFPMAKGLPVFGGTLSSKSYCPMSRDQGFYAGPAIIVCILGGDFDFEAQSVSLKDPLPVHWQDKQNDPAKYQAALLSQETEVVKPVAAMAKKFKWGPDQNLLLLTGHFHGGDAAWVAKGLAESVPAGVAVAGGAGNASIILQDRFVAENRALLALRISGKFEILQQVRGACWKASDQPVEKYQDLLANFVMKEMPKPDLMLNFLCASWAEAASHAAFFQPLDATLSKDIPFFGAFSGGEIYRNAKGEINGGGGMGVVTLIQAMK